MKKHLFIVIVLFIYIKSYSQQKTLYFLANKKDTLIIKITNSSTGLESGYKITDENKIVTKYKSSTVSKPKSVKLKEGEIWVTIGDDIEYKGFANYYFTFNRDEDTIVSKSYFDSLKVIKDRRKFLEIIEPFDETRTEFIFIEPLDCDTYVLRKVRPLIFE